MILIAGLGNPGASYERTRHNVGFRVVQKLGEGAGGASWNKKERFSAELLPRKAEDFDVLLMKPTTFMNDSGKAVAAVAAFYQIPAARIFVIHDELDVPFGTLRIRPGGSAAGHHGVQSVIDSLGTKDFVRFRIGIGPKRPETMPAEDFVLKRFSTDEEEQLGRIIAQAADTVLRVAKDPARAPETLSLR
jgi:PTH1 family peptidyl-tRNA hydrolase